MIGSLDVIAPNGEITKMENLTQIPDLSVLQKSVVGGFEIVPGFTEYEHKKCIAYCNPNGPIVILTGDKEWMTNMTAQLTKQF